MYLFLFLIYFTLLYFFFIYEINKVKQLFNNLNLHLNEIIFYFFEEYISILNNDEIEINLNKQKKEKILKEIVKLDKMYSLINFLINVKIIKKINFYENIKNKLTFLIFKNELHVYIPKKILNSLNNLSFEIIYNKINTYLFNLKEEKE